MVGDIRGDFPSLLRVFEYGGFPPESRYLFLGSICGRDTQQMECVCLLLAYKIKYPEHIYILKGYHEIKGVNKVHGLYDPCLELIRKERSQSNTVLRFGQRLFTEKIYKTTKNVAKTHNETSFTAIIAN